MTVLASDPTLDRDTDDCRQEIVRVVNEEKRRSHGDGEIFWVAPA